MSVLDPVQNELNPNIWDENKKLKDSVAMQIQGILKTAEINLSEYNIVDMYIIGSNTGYNYSNSTDIDCHIRIDNFESQEASDILWGKLAKINESNICLTDTENPFQFYVLSGNELEHSVGKGAVYSLLRDEWIVEPSKDDIKVPYSYILELAKVFMAGADNRIMEYESDVQEKILYEKYLEVLDPSKDSSEIEEIKAKIAQKELEIKADLDAVYMLKNYLYEMRSGAYVSDKKGNDQFNLFLSFGDGNFSVQNLIYKMIERTGYLDKLKKYTRLRQQYKQQTNISV